MNRLHYSVQVLVVTATFLSGSLVPQGALADSSAETQTLTDALTEIESVDGQGRWFSYGIALAGGAVGLGLGGWALYESPLASKGGPDPVVFGSSILVASSALVQILHGGMRFDERGISAAHARILLEDKAAREAAGVLFLRDRAAEAESTRYWGAVLTTAQGLGTAALGLRLWTGAKGGEHTAGIVFTVMGIVNTGVGAVHFFGKPRSERILNRTAGEHVQPLTMRLGPAYLTTPRQEGLPGISLSGHF